MRHSCALALLLSWFFIGVFSPNSAAAPHGWVSGQKKLLASSARRSQTISHGRITDIRPINDTGANTGKKLITISPRTLAIAKPPSEITMLAIAKGSEPNREVLTYRTSLRLFGKQCAVIPPTFFRIIDGVEHSVQKWVSQHLPDQTFVKVINKELPFGMLHFAEYNWRIPLRLLQRLDRDSVHSLVILDYITNHPDRRPGNWMIVEVGGRYHLRGIDNGVNWILDRNLPSNWYNHNDPIYFAVEMARRGFGQELSAKLKRTLAQTDTRAWRAELKQGGLSELEIRSSLRALKRVQRLGLRAVFTHPRKATPVDLILAGRSLFR